MREPKRLLHLVTDYYKVFLYSGGIGTSSEIHTAQEKYKMKDAFKNAYFHFSHHGKGKRRFSDSRFRRRTAILCQPNHDLTNRSLLPCLGISPPPTLININWRKRWTLSTLQFNLLKPFLYFPVAIDYPISLRCIAMRWQRIKVISVNPPTVQRGWSRGPAITDRLPWPCLICQHNRWTKGNDPRGD